MGTVVLGSAEDKVCLDFATFMLLDNYQKDPGLLQPESAAGMREIDAKWDRVTTPNVGVELPSGFYATLYKPKDGTTCPPTLALRGTVFDDARGVAFGVRLKAYPAFAPSEAIEFSYGFAPGAGVDGTADNGQQTAADVSALDDMLRQIQNATFTVIPGGGILRKIAEIRAAAAASPKTGTLAELTSSGNWIELFQTRGLNTMATRRLNMLPAMPLIPADYREVVLEMSFEIWFNRDEGDWATNVIQGIGEDTLQYNTQLKAAVDDAIITARECDNQLRITGHSLGGGMAAAASIYAKKAYPDITIYGLGYDSAGVHPQTAKRLGTSLNMASEAKILARAVEDEVLTSMEKPTDFVPIASSLIRFTGDPMPPPIGTLVDKKGISPGPIGNSWEPTSNASVVPGHVFAPKWGEMPNLLSLATQTLIPGVNGVNPLATWDNLAGHFAAASNMGAAIDNINGYINGRVQANRDARADSERQEELREAESERADAAREAEAERLEAAREAASERAEAEREAAARAYEAEQEANEPTGILGVLYDGYDEARDGLRNMRNAGREVVDEVGDLGSAIGDEAGDLGRGLLDEAGDGLANIGDFGGDVLNFAYEHTLQYLVEFATYGIELGKEAADFGELFMGIAAYHDMELAAFTFAVER